MTEYRWASEADYRNIIEFANRAFDPKNHTEDYEKDTSAASYFPRILPKLYQNIRTAPMHRIAVQDGKIVGCVGNFVLPTVVCGEQLNVVGIGTVSTHPDHRREGHMLRLMADSVAHAKEAGADFMVLGGMRQRYEHWGFEFAGPDPEFRMTDTCMRHRFGAEASFGYTFRKMEKTDTDFIAKEKELRTSALTYTVHGEDQEYAILCSMGSDPYVILKDGEFRGTFMKFTDHNEMTDLRLVDQTEVLHIFNDLLKDGQFFSDEDGEHAFRVNHIALYDTAMIRLLAESCDGVIIGHCQQMKILNYRRTVGSYLKLAAAYRELADGEAKFSFENGEKIVLRVREGVPSAEDYTGEDTIPLGELEAVNLLFGESSYLTGFGKAISPEVKSWFPLPFFQYMSDEV